VNAAELFAELTRRNVYKIASEVLEITESSALHAAGDAETAFRQVEANWTGAETLSQI
jgi:hypothetical protein